MEKVLCFKSKNMPKMSDKLVPASSFDVAQEDLIWVDREKAEKDESYKQVIPYAVIWRGREVFCYKRTKKGGENRLHEKWSVGVGGHINPADKKAEDLVVEGLRRELAEEVGLPLDKVKYELKGFIYDNSDAVGRVHFGLVYFVHLANGQAIQTTDPALVNGEFVHALDINKHKKMFESWSALVIEKLVS